MTKAKLSDFLREAISSNEATQEDAAEAAKITFDTLRTSLTRNRFTEPLLTSLLPALKIDETIESLRSKYTFTLTTAKGTYSRLYAQKNYRTIAANLRTLVGQYEDSIITKDEYYKVVHRIAAQMIKDNEENNQSPA